MSPVWEVSGPSSQAAADPGCHKPPPGLGELWRNVKKQSDTGPWSMRYPTAYENKPRAPFKSQYIQQYVLKSHQVWCQIKAWVLNFLGMSLDMKIRLKLSEICKET